MQVPFSRMQLMRVQAFWAGHENKILQSLYKLPHPSLEPNGVKNMFAEVVWCAKKNPVKATNKGPL